MAFKITSSIEVVTVYRFFAKTKKLVYASVFTSIYKLSISFEILNCNINYLVLLLIKYINIL